MDRGILGILFDLQGTLLDPRPRTGDARALFDAGTAKVYALLATRGCALPPFERFLRQQHSHARRIDWITWFTGGEPDARRLLRRLCADYGLQRDQASLALLGGLWYGPTAELAELPGDVIPTLTTLRDADIKLGLVVNTFWQGEVIDRHLESLGLLEFFTVRAYSSEHGSRKPHPNLFRAALGEMKLPADQVIFVGDDPATDLVGARRVGMKAVLRAATPSKRGRKLADYIIQRIGQLTEIFQPVSEPSRPPMMLPPLNAVAT